MAKFYDHAYWQSGSGELLWNLRKMIAVIMHIQNENTPEPFFTVMSDEETPEKWYSWHAEWLADYGDGRTAYFHVEYEDKAFSMYAFHPWDGKAERLGFAFYYIFGVDEEGDHPWDDFDEALAAGKKWLKDNNEFIQNRPNSLRRLFNLEP